MTNDTITKTVFLNTDRKTVWSFLTEKDKLGQWFHPAEADLADGEDYRLIEQRDDDVVKGMCWGTVQCFEPPSKLVYSFTVAPLNGAMTTVTWTLEDAHGGTRLTMVHEGVGAAAGKAALGILGALDGGWDKHFGTLRALVREKQPTSLR